MTDEIKELKRKIKLARAQGLLMGAKSALEALKSEVDTEGLIKLITEVLGLIDEK